MGAITALSAVGLAAGLALTGAHVASASTASVASVAASTAARPALAGVPDAAAHADITLPSGGILEKRVTRFCNRVPTLIERADKAETRISGDATTKGSLAWLNARKAKATANGHTRVVNRIERRITRRTDRLKKLPQVKKNLATASNECATLDLPTTSTPTPSAGS